MAGHDKPATLEESAAELLKEAKRIIATTKWRIRLFIGVLVLSLIAMAAFGLVAVQANHAAKEAKLAATKASAALVAACESGNDYRNQDHDLWTKVFSLTDQGPPPRGETAAERKRREQVTAQFKAFIEVHDRIRVCKK